MPICYVNPDGSHVRGCEQHMGKHPWDWCRDRREERRKRIEELRNEIDRLLSFDIDDPELPRPTLPNVDVRTWLRKENKPPWHL